MTSNPSVSDVLTRPGLGAKYRLRIRRQCARDGGGVEGARESDG